MSSLEAFGIACGVLSLIVLGCALIADVAAVDETWRVPRSAWIATVALGAIALGLLVGA